MLGNFQVGLDSLRELRFFPGVLYEVSSADPLAYLGAGALLLVIGAVASALPAWRAANGDPLQALRSE